jgi:hypothetical protein
VTPTGEKHHCCGKELAVVAVEFAPGASLDLTDLFQQLTKNAASPHKISKAFSSPWLPMADKRRFSYSMNGPACVRTCCSDGVTYCVTEDGVRWAAHAGCDEGEMPC